MFLWVGSGAPGGQTADGKSGTCGLRKITNGFKNVVELSKNIKITVTRMFVHS